MSSVEERRADPAGAAGAPAAGGHEAYGALRPLARRARAAWTALLHPGRRTRARRRIATLAPRSILFICHGNINRSAYAEAVFRHAGELGVRAASAGFIGPGRASPEIAVSVARERGVAMDAHRARLVEPALVRSFELVVVMDRRQAKAIGARFGVPGERILLLGDLDPETPERRLVQDPVERPRADYERIFGRIERCVDELVRCLPR